MFITNGGKKLFDLRGIAQVSLYKQRFTAASPNQFSLSPRQLRGPGDSELLPPPHL